MRILWLMKWPREMLQILSYFWNMNSYFIFFSFRANFFFPYIYIFLLYSKKMANFESFHCWGHFIKHKPFISDEWQQHHSLCAGKPFYDLSDFYRCEAGHTTNWAALGTHARIKKWQGHAMAALMANTTALP